MEFHQWNMEFQYCIWDSTLVALASTSDAHYAHRIAVAVYTDFKDISCLLIAVKIILRFLSCLHCRWGYTNVFALFWKLFHCIKIVSIAVPSVFTVA